MFSIACLICVLFALTSTLNVITLFWDKSLVLIRTATKNPGKINEAEELITYEVVEHAEEVETTEETVNAEETVEEN